MVVLLIKKRYEKIKLKLSIWKTICQVLQSKRATYQLKISKEIDVDSFQGIGNQSLPFKCEKHQILLLPLLDDREIIHKHPFVCLFPQTKYYIIQTPKYKIQSEMYTRSKYSIHLILQIFLYLGISQIYRLLHLGMYWMIPLHSRSIDFLPHQDI